MANEKFWNGFTVGAVAGAAAASLGAWQVIGWARSERVLRLEKSLQIGRPVEEVFAAWTRLDHLPQLVDFIERIEQWGHRSRWVVNLNGKRLQWDAEITQLIPNQALGWKSLRGPKHTGRIDFSPLGNDTLIHVSMNYCPPAQMARLFSPLVHPMEHYIDEVFRAFKASLEGKGRESTMGDGGLSTGSAPMPPRPAEVKQERSTGTYGQPADMDRHTQTSRFGGQPESSIKK